MPEFVTRDSGQREEYSTGMRRDTTDGKPRFDLVVPVFLPYEEQFLHRLAMLMTRGAVKYGERNWERARTAEELRRFRGSAFRHFMQWLTSADEEEDHAAAVVFNLIAAEYAWYHLEHPEAMHPANMSLTDTHVFGADREIPGTLNQANPQPTDVTYHQHDQPLATYFLAPGAGVVGPSGIHDAMKPHKHEDGQVIPL